MYYKSLFDVNIHHGYFLDKGEEKYSKVNNDDDEMSADDKEEALKTYNVSEYLKITPSDFTKTQFRNYRMMMRTYSSGFRVLVNTLEKKVGENKKYKPLIPLEDDVYLTFELQATDEYFYNYSDVFDLSNKRLYLFTNVEPANQDAVFENVFENNGGFIDDRFLLKEEESRELLKYIALEDENFMVYKTGVLSLGRSIRLIQNNEELTNDQKDTQIESLLNYTIQKKKKKQVIGYVRLRIKGDTNDRHLLEYSGDDQFTKSTAPNFTLSFINLRTYWRFISLVDEAKLTTKEQKWLSRNGYVEITSADFDSNGLDPPTTDPEDYNFPNPTVDLIKEEDNNYYSEIFI